MSAFDDSFAALIGNEGRYTDNQADSGNWTGGRIGVGSCIGTCWGVSAPVLAAYLKREPTKEEMENLSQDTAKTIAKANYWDVYSCDQLPPVVAFQVFDAAYNGGFPAMWLQQAAGVRVDGKIGALTVQAVNSTDPDKIVMRFDAYRLRYMGGLASWPSFGRGWANRIADNLIRAAS